MKISNKQYKEIISLLENEFIDAFYCGYNGNDEKDMDFNDWAKNCLENIQKILDK